MSLFLKPDTCVYFGWNRQGPPEKHLSETQRQQAPRGGRKSSGTGYPQAAIDAGEGEEGGLGERDHHLKIVE